MSSLKSCPHAEPHDLVELGSRVENPRAQAFWRSLDELDQKPEFREFLEREFPSQLSVWDNPLERRNFMRIMAASFALAGVTGCVRNPQEEIVPYVQAPEEFIPGKPLFFASAVARGGYAHGVLVESHMGRPTKIEGNPEHPASLGATDATIQASILSLYDPDRSQTLIRRGVIETWRRFQTEMTEVVERVRGNEGRGLRILTDLVTSPTLAAQLEQLQSEFPQLRWHQYQAVNRDHFVEGTRQAFGRDVDVLYQFDQAAVVVSLDADFLLDPPWNVRHARDFSTRRRPWQDAAAMSRLYVFESTPTITGAKADHRWPLLPHQVYRLAAALAARLGVAGAAEDAAQGHGVPLEWLDAVVEDLEANRGRSLIIAGRQQPPAVHALVHALNQALGNAPTTVSYIEPVAARPEVHRQSLAELVEDMRNGEVETLIILGGNPVYTAPAGLDFAGALQKVGLRVHWSERFDETSRLCDWHLPAAHFLESWSDLRALDGTASIIQPLIAPLYGGKSVHEVVELIVGRERTSYSIVQQYWRERLGEGDFGRLWRKAVHDGVIAGTVSPAIQPNLNLAPEVFSQAPPAPPEGEVAIEIRPDAKLGDGSMANNAWLQELPHPITKLTWGNAALVSPAMAKRQGLFNGEVISIEAGGQTLDVPVWITPGQPDNCVSLSLGYGREESGRIGTRVGYNAFQLLPANGAAFVAGSIRPAGRSELLVATQNHHSMEGRDIVRVTTRERLAERTSPEDAKHHGQLPSLYPEYDYEKQPNAWGMVIDQTACIGCNACVVACQAENNIPVVGKEQVQVGREMHWLRIDRYFHGEMENPETYFQPMMCVHCEKAPCEVVCPVAATVHDAEGTSNMVYNRCVGTRYCSNNCPYKVRRFNFLQYSDETTPSLKLMRNPDVTVRSRGVMEKCSYCIQRINVGRIAAKKENRAVADGEVLTACQQACPTQAIVFGNLNDEASNVRRQKALPLNYGVLAELNTQPRTTYLPDVLNPHPRLPQPSAAEIGPLGAPLKDKAHS